ncbi:protein of unknown function (plasmid) [Cupriavidus neocaledonicus]|uniref:Uncharacterized protein n=1 Tax=Cupriavidus neocaledonicus TaxID=1040979 RepID=A0A375HUC8_9BURK|nr:hypothetical protein CBM2605_B90086 [Cupriavidus neocaledonicus]SPD60317.1 protein of unknown function [Cupriavidus neocaledonicus]
MRLFVVVNPRFETMKRDAGRILTKQLEDIECKNQIMRRRRKGLRGMLRPAPCRAWHARACTTPWSSTCASSSSKACSRRAPNSMNASCARRWGSRARRCARRSRCWPPRA